MGSSYAVGVGIGILVGGGVVCVGGMDAVVGIDDCGGEAGCVVMVGELTSRWGFCWVNLVAYGIFLLYPSPH